MEHGGEKEGERAEEGRQKAKKCPATHTLALRHNHAVGQSVLFVVERNAAVRCIPGQESILVALVLFQLLVCVGHLERKRAGISGWLSENKESG